MSDTPITTTSIIFAGYTFCKVKACCCGNIIGRSRPNERQEAKRKTLYYLLVETADGGLSEDEDGIAGRTERDQRRTFDVEHGLVVGSAHHPGLTGRLEVVHVGLTDVILELGVHSYNKMGKSNRQPLPDKCKDMLNLKVSHLTKFPRHVTKFVLLKSHFGMDLLIKNRKYRLLYVIRGVIR